MTRLMSEHRLTSPQERLSRRQSVKVRDREGMETETKRNGAAGQRDWGRHKPPSPMAATATLYLRVCSSHAAGRMSDWELALRWRCISARFLLSCPLIRRIEMMRSAAVPQAAHRHLAIKVLCPSGFPRPLKISEAGRGAGGLGQGQERNGPGATDKGAIGREIGQAVLSDPEII